MLERTRKNKRSIGKRFFKILPIVVVAFIVIGGLVVWYSLLQQDKKVSSPLPLDQKLNIISLVSGTDRVEKLLKEEGIAFESVSIASSGAYIVSIEDNGNAIVNDDNLPKQIASLQVITSRLTMEGKRFSWLDLRFERPVIVLR